MLLDAIERSHNQSFQKLSKNIRKNFITMMD